MKRSVMTPTLALEDNRGPFVKPLRIVLAAVVVAVIVCLFLLPFMWLISSGLKTQERVFSDVNPLSWRTFIPVNPTFDNVIELFRDGGLGSAMLNSLIIALMQVGGTLILAPPAAYALTRIRFRGRGVVLAIILATFMLPAEALVVPMYSVFSSMGLQDTLIAVALPWIASAFGLFLLTPGFEEIPIELDEAARIDGANHFRIFWSVILPNVKTSLITLCLMVFLFSWNSFLWPLVIIQSPQKQVVQVAIAQSVSPGTLPNWGLTFAGAAIATLPLIILFLALQRYFVKGLASSGLK